MKPVTRGDIFDFYIKIKQEGIRFIRNKTKINKNDRVENNWNENKNVGGFWNIPYFMKHWNELITGSPKVNYPEYICKKYLNNQQKYTLLSIGSGTGFYEREFAKQKCFSKIVGIELSENRALEAEKLALENNLNIKYLNRNIFDIDFNDERFDLILFNSSLHHFDNIEIFLSKYIKPLLKEDGFLIICEYVGKNRLYIPNFQLKEINKLLKTLPKKYRK